MAGRNIFGNFGTPNTKVDGWSLERTLGAGGFGTVTLFKNEDSGEYIAIKKCTIHGEMNNPQLRNRWKLECDIMLRLEHPNVIKAYPVPEALNVRENDMPLLAMEYCEGGDLRKVLNKPENCCGLSEVQVKDIIRDVASAVEYLHSKRIIHRDLKPENIVISTIEAKMVYKLIDLGYAKDLDQGSVCTSFVGTMQYLAPELFMSQKYTATVDYWSFGTLAFECCVGFRPFFHNVPPIKWQHDVENKHRDDIHALFQDGKPSFSKNLPFPNYICRTYKFYLEQWLRYMLIWDPKERGGGLMDNGRPRCFALLENILSTKLLQVFIIPRNELYTYPLNDPKVTLRDIMVIIERETAIPIDQQEILLANGTIIEPEQPALMCLPETPEGEPEEEEWLVFLINKNESSFQQKTRKITNMPPKVNDMVNDPRTLTMYPEQKLAWGHSFFFCRQVRRDYDRLLAAQRALMLCLLRYHSTFTKQQAELKTDMGSLQSKIELFRKCHDYDLTFYQNQSQTGISSQKMFDNWTELGNQVEKFATIEKEVERLEQSCVLINQMVMELNRSPKSRSTQESVLKDIEDKVLELYTKLRHTPIEQRNRHPGDNMPMVSTILKGHQLRQRLTEDIYLHMGKVIQCRKELLTTLPNIQLTIKTIREAGKRLVNYQLQRQKDMWQLVSVALKQNKQLRQKQKEKHQQQPQTITQPVSLQLQLDESGNRNQQQGGASNGGMIGRSMSRSSVDSSQSSVSHSSILIDRFSEKSLQVLAETHNTRNKLESALLSMHEQTIQKAQEEPLDWDFLTDTTTNQMPTKTQDTKQNNTVPLAASTKPKNTDTSSNSWTLLNSTSGYSTAGSNKQQMPNNSTPSHQLQPQLSDLSSDMSKLNFSSNSPQYFTQQIFQAPDQQRGQPFLAASKSDLTRFSPTGFPSGIDSSNRYKPPL